MAKLLLLSIFLKIGLCCYSKGHLDTIPASRLEINQLKQNSLLIHRFDTFKILLKIPLNFGQPKYETLYAFFEDVNQDSTIYGSIQIQPEFGPKENPTDQLISMVGWFGFARGEPGQNNISQLHIRRHINGYMAEYYLLTKDGHNLKGLTLGFKKKKTSADPDSLWDYIYITYLGLEEHYVQNSDNLNKVFMSVRNIDE